MNRKSLTFGESNVAALAAFFGAFGGTLVLSAVAILSDLLTDGSFSESDGYSTLTMVLTQVLMFAGAFFYRTKGRWRGGWRHASDGARQRKTHIVH
jgi:hypothetical protein